MALSRFRPVCLLAASALLVALVGAPAHVAAQPARGSAGKAPTAEEQAIRAGTQAYAKAYNAGDAKALAAFWTLDGDYTDEQGSEFRGRAEIEKMFEATFASQPGVKLDVQTESVRFLSPDVALETGTAWAVPTHGNPTSARYSATLVKRDGAWLLASVRDSARVAASNAEYLRGLEWLIGQWQATAGDARVNVKVEWIANRNFLSRTFSTETGGKITQSGTQIIGWDPRSGEIVSWHFDSDGGFGRDRWNKRGNKWFIETSGVLRDGGASSALNSITPGDANSFTWESTARLVNGTALPDTEPVKFQKLNTSR